MQVTPKELFDRVKTWRILPHHVDVRLGSTTFEAVLTPRQLANWEISHGGVTKEKTGILTIDIYEVRHVRIRTLSEEVLWQMGFGHWVAVTDKYGLQLDDEITIIFFRR